MIKIILPAYNEEKALPNLFDRFINMMRENRLKDFQILLINDGSKDGTDEVASSYLNKLPLLIIGHEENKGLGRAIKTGFEAALEEYSDEDIFVVLDADNTHNPDVINTMIDKIKEGYDVIIASRYAPGGKEIGLNFFRRSLSKGANFLLKLFFRIDGVDDYTCGFRAYRPFVIKKGFDTYKDFIEEKGFTCMAEILIKLNTIGARIVELPFILRYDLKKGKSKMKNFKTIIRYCLLISRKRFITLKGGLDEGLSI